MEAILLNMNMFNTFRDMDGQKVVRLFNNSGAAYAKGAVARWVAGASGRDEAVAIVASRDQRQRVVFARKAVASAVWGDFVVDGPIQAREEADGLEAVTVPSATYTAGNGLRVDPFSAALQDSGVAFNFQDESIVAEIVVGGTTVTSIQVRLHERESVWNSKGLRNIDDKLQSRPLFVDEDGDGAPTGVAADVNIMLTPEAGYEYHIKGTQTIVKPVWAVSGLDIGMDQTADDGVEITNGITTSSKAFFKARTDSCFFRVKLKIADVSGTDDLAIGFRKAEAYQANVDDYFDMAVLNVIAGAIKIETILANAATVTTDTTNTWADAATKTLEVRVDSAGKVTYRIDDAAPTTVAAYTFALDLSIVPFLFFLNDVDLAGAVEIIEWHVGLFAE